MFKRHYEVNKLVKDKIVTPNDRGRELKSDYGNEVAPN